jgi:hypothetical protein
VPVYEINGKKVPEQRLNDTTIVPIAQGFSTKVGVENKTGLMQGFLTLPWLCKQYPELHIINYFDILGTKLFTGGVAYDYNDGKQLSFDGQYSSVFGPNLGNIPPRPGVGDSHNGIDFFVPIGNFVVAGSPQGNITLFSENQGEPITSSTYVIDNVQYGSRYGHQSDRLITLQQTFSRGQILGLSSNTGKNSGGYQQIHFDVFLRQAGGANYNLDPFRSLVSPSSISSGVIYWGNPVSIWTIDNVPVFSDACNN